MTTKADNVAAVRELRLATDAAEGVRILRGLEEVLAAGEASGEISPDVRASLSYLLIEAYVFAGSTDAERLERKAKRLREALVRANMPLVWKVARRTMGARKGNQANLDEAVQEGAIGLMRAIDEFDPERGSFATCAAFWIRHHVQNAMFKQVDFAKQRSACMPAPVVRACNRFRLRHGREPEPHEIEFKGRPCSAEDWARWTDAAYVTSVQDMTGNAEDGATPDEMLADESSSPDAIVATVAMQDRIDREMHAMSPRNREMSRRLFIEGETLTEVANHYGLSVERVRELKIALEKKLRSAVAA